MYNTMIITVVMNAVPVSALVFVVVLVAHKVYKKIRARYNIKVNCWFCNENTKVAYGERNSWNCPHCEQYNGFNKDGDYNREIYQQLDCSNLSFSSRSSDEARQLTLNNGFCDACNEAQRIKVEKLAQFEPKYESRFDAELKIYKKKLEEQYRLCATCDRHLKKVLREKKKMVLGSKFMQYVLQGANMLKQPHLMQLKQQQRILWKQRITFCTNLMALINICCLVWSLTIPELSLQKLTEIFGDFLGHWLFYLGSHGMALVRVLRSYIESLSDNELMLKLRLFCRTVFLMLLYSLGFKLPQLMRVNFTALFTTFSPYVLLVLAFAYNVLDNWRSVRYIALVTMWCLAAADFISVSWLSSAIILLLASLTTLALNLTEPKGSSIDSSHDKSQSFHRLYAEDYLSDEDTLSLLSEQLSSSAASQRSEYSFTQQKVSPRAPLTKSPLSANNNFQNPTNIGFRYGSSLHSPYAASVCSLGGTATQNHYNAYMPIANKQMQKQRFGAGLLSPSRFNNTLNSNNHCYAASQHNASQQHYDMSSMLHKARSMSNMSRCSSHSSGFESQPNERAFCAASSICGRESVMSEINGAYLAPDYRTAFQPILPHATQPFPVNYMSSGADRFNFQQFDAQLPRYRRGDLLKKFKETQSVM